MAYQPTKGCFIMTTTTDTRTAIQVQIDELRAKREERQRIEKEQAAHRKIQIKANEEKAKMKYENKVNKCRIEVQALLNKHNFTLDQVREVYFN